MVYLNNAATSWPKAPGVAEAVRSALERPIGEVARGGSRENDPVEGCRELVARLLGVAEPSCIVFTMNATMALNIAIQGLALGPGDLIVTSAAEHNSVLRPIEKLRSERGVEADIVRIASNGLPDEDEFLRALARRPRLVALTHASNVTGRVFPVARWFEQAKAMGAFTLLDASQSLGHIRVSPAALGADLVAFTGHKGLLGPAGTGGLYVGPRIDLEQLLVGGTGGRSDMLGHPPDMPGRLEAGTHNLPGLAGLSMALQWLMSNADEHCRMALKRASQLRAGLAGIPGVEIFDGKCEGERIGILSFRIAGWKIEEAGVVLNDSFGIASRAGLHCAPRIHECIGSAPAGTLRFSVSGFNTEDDIGAAIAAVRGVAQCAC